MAHFRAIRDSHGRIIAAMTHNTDVSNSWERETEDPAYFYQFSIDGYALGINVLLYAIDALMLVTRSPLEPGRAARGNAPPGSKMLPMRPCLGTVWTKPIWPPSPGARLIVASQSSTDTMVFHIGSISHPGWIWSSPPSWLPGRSIPQGRHARDARHIGHVEQRGSSVVALSIVRSSASTHAWGIHASCPLGML